MNKYRIKQVGGEFYPQYKKIFGWRYYKGEPYLDYDIILNKRVYFYNLYFNSLEDANNFLIKEKSSDTITYHNI